MKDETPKVTISDRMGSTGKLTTSIYVNNSARKLIGANFFLIKFFTDYIEVSSPDIDSVNPYKFNKWVNTVIYQGENSEGVYVFDEIINDVFVFIREVR